MKNHTQTHKTLLALLIIGTAGCCSSIPFKVDIKNPAELRPNEELLQRTDEDNEQSTCASEVYAGFENGHLQSVLEMSHCFYKDKFNGSFHWTRYQDRDADGKVDTICKNRGTSYFGEKVGSPTCDYDSTFYFSPYAEKSPDHDMRERIDYILFNKLGFSYRFTKHTKH